MRNELLNKIRSLSQLLMLSGTCNILMFALVIYWYAKEHPPTPVCEKKPTDIQNIPIAQATSSNQLVIQSFADLDFKTLVQELHQSETLENGFTHRDLALGYLITEHHFDSNRAFIELSKPAQPRRIIYQDLEGKSKELRTYADFKEMHFLAAISFGSKEKWPFTAEGLFYLLDQNEGEAKKSLKYAFYLTQEFMSVELLFKRSNENIQRDELLQMLLEGPWDSLAKFAEYQRVSQDLSDRQRRHFLASYVKAGSPTAASLMLKTDAAYAVKHLTDEEAVAILVLSNDLTRDAAKYALTMLASPRNDAVWKAAAIRLYQYTGDPVPNDLNKSLAIKRFLPNLVEKTAVPSLPPKPLVSQQVKQPSIVKTEVPSPAAKPSKKKQWKRGYTVKKGDTLWKIGHLFNVDVRELKEYNNIHNEELTPGTMIIVP